MGVGMDSNSWIYSFTCYLQILSPWHYNKAICILDHNSGAYDILSRISEFFFTQGSLTPVVQNFVCLKK